MLRTSRLVLSALVLAAAASASKASIISWDTLLSGAAESPPNASPATGYSYVNYDDVAHTLQIHIEFNGLIGGTTASHIHSATAIAGVGTAGVATTTPTFAGWPVGATSGVYDNTLNLTLASSFNPTFVTNNGGTLASAEAALIAGIVAGKAYVNVHSSAFPGGEIRGFLPEPASIAMLSLAGVALLRRRR